MFGVGLNIPHVVVRRVAVTIPPLLASVDPGGWSGQAALALALPAMTTDGTSEFGADGVAPKTLAVLRQGFDATGAAARFLEPVTITKRVRQAYPNHASATAATVALSDYVFAADAVAGCTNNSTEISPAPVAQWSRPDRHVMTTTDTAAVVAFHRCGATLGNLGIACVKFTWTDGTNTVTATVTTPTSGGHAGDLFPVIEFVAANVDISSLNNGPVTRNATVYPKVGTNASLAASGTGTPGARAFAPQTILKSAAAPIYAYVSTTGTAGGVTSTTAALAAATPFDTFKGAADALKTAMNVVGAQAVGIVRIGNGSFNIAALSATVLTTAGEVIVERDGATATRAQAVVSWGVNASGAHNLAGMSWVRFRDLSLLRTGATTLRAVSGGSITLENVNFDQGTQGSGGFAGITGAAKINIFGLGMTVTNPGANCMTGAVGSHDWLLTRGVAMGSILPATPFLVESWAVLGSSLPGCRIDDNTKGQSGTIVAFNKRLGVGGTSYGPDIAKASNVTGYAYVQNNDEWASGTANPGMGISRDASVITASTGNTSHVILWHNSHAGFFNHGRHNIFYDEKPGTYRTHKLMSCVGNVAVALNTKHDVFLGVNGNGSPDPADAPLHIGGWPYLYGVGCVGEFSRYIDANNSGLGSPFAQAWPGLKAKIGTANSGAGQDPLFTAYAATTTASAAGAGGGDYSVGSGSPVKAMVAGGPLAGLPDLSGAARTGAQSAGAYQ
ncbi:MAG TPA: hypothetical protein VL405_02610 [Sphingomonas sp.]|nr:hypothetical protein [Sphingomonas sp.]